MDSRWIASTPNQGLRPVGAPGQRDYGLLVQVLTQHLGADHAGLFAEPVPNPDGRTTDWYAPQDGEAEALDALAPTARAEAERRLRQRYDDIRALADRLAQSRDPDAVQKAALLQAALEIPDPGFVRVVGGQPVLLGWAHLKDYPDAPRGVLGSWIQTRRPAATPPPGAASAMAPAAAAAAPAAAAILPVVVERRVLVSPVGWLWLLFALLAATIGYLMLIACGVGWPGGGVWPGWLARCPLPAAIAANDDLARELERQRQLEQEIAQLQRQLAGAAASCTPQPPPTRAELPPAPPPEPAPAPPPEPPPPTQAELPPQTPPECQVSELDRRRQEAGGQTGQVTVSLGWEGDADLDLAVACPGGGTIWFNERSACGARLDVDMNASGKFSPTPIENVFWPSKPANGTYEVYVSLYSRKTDRRRAIPFRVELDVLGNRRQVDGTIERARQAMLVTRFEITDAPPPAEQPACPPVGPSTDQK